MLREREREGLYIIYVNCNLSEGERDSVSLNITIDRHRYQNHRICYMTLDTCEKEIQAVADPESIQPIADGTFVSNMDANVQRFQLDLDILDLQIPTQ